jgi:Cdc6-like AAA superfamily ATPase
MEWLSSMNFAAQQYDFLIKRESGTGKWFIESVEFQAWLRGCCKALFCPGIPGAGKTIIAATAIDHLLKTVPNTDVGIAYAYCNYKQQDSQNSLSLLTDIFKQLVQFRPDIADIVYRLYDDYFDRKSRPLLGQILSTIRSVCANYTRVFIVVDALDELTAKDNERTRLLDHLGTLQSLVDVNLMITSRFVLEIEQWFQAETRLEVRACDQDVRRYVASQVPRLPTCIQRDDGLIAEIQNKIAEKADGMSV